MSGIFDQVINYSPPSLLTGTVTYEGTWSAATNTPTLPNPPSSVTNGHYYVVSAGGTQFSLVFNIGDWIISNGSAWEKVDNTDAVDSVFGRTGAVVGVSTDYSAVGITNTALGASNPSTVAATTITASSTIAATGAVTGSNLSGTNTGDQTITLTGGVTGSGTGSFAATVVTNANLTGVITSSGNATSIASQTGTGTKFVVDTSPVLITPNIGVATGTSLAAALNGTLGATTPSSVAATTGTFSSTLGVTGVATLGNGAILGTPASGNLASCTGYVGTSALVTVGALNSGSITSGFGSIDVGADAISGGAISGTTGTFTGHIATSQNLNDSASLSCTNASSGTAARARVLLIADAGNASVFATSTGYTDITGAADSMVFAANSLSGGYQFSIDGAVAVAKITSTGLNSTAIGATTPSTGAFTTLGATGAISTTATSGSVFSSNVATTAGRYIQLGNTGNNASYFGVENSTANALGANGLTAYDAFIYSGGPGFGVVASGSLRFRVDGNGAAITGTLSASGNTLLGGATFPSTAHPNATQIRVGLVGNVFSQNDAGLGVGGMSLVGNAYLKSSSGDWAYLTSAKASRVSCNAGSVFLQTSTGTDTADAAASFSTKAEVSSTGLAVTGTLSCTTGANFATSSGSVGIGTASPAGILDVSTANVGAENTIFLRNTDNTNAASGARVFSQVGGASSGDPRFVLSVTGIQEYYLGIDNSDSDKFMIGSGSDVGITPWLTINTSGNVGIGTASPGTKLEVVGALLVTQSASNTASATFTSSHATTPTGAVISFSGGTPNDATQMFLTCGDTTNTKFQLRSNGGLGNYSANNANLSDRRLKENFVSFTESASEIINRLEVTQFNYIGQKRTVLGVVAQQVETVAPWLVESSGFGETPKDGIPYKSIYQTDLEFLVIKALQEQDAELQSLRKRLAALEAK